MRFIQMCVVSLIFLAGALPANAQKLSLGEVSRYLNTVQSASAEITQVNSDGTLSTGTLSIKRPGKMRFDYNPPELALVIVGAGAVNILDRRMGQVPEVYPLSQTPLSIILARSVNLGQTGMVKSHDFDGTATIVTAQDPRRPEQGTIQLKFTADPVELRQWIITDGNGQKTTVILGALEQTSLPNSLFDIRREVAKLER